jgi:RNA-binding protein
MDPIPKLQIGNIFYRTHIHATESIEKNVKALQNIIPFILTPKEYSIDHLTGSYSNPIRVITIKIQKKQDVKLALGLITHNLSKSEKKSLCDEIEHRVDIKNKFYFRLEKQQIAQGKIKLAESSDVIQIIISILNKTPNILLTVDHLLKYFKEMGLISCT